MKTIKLLALAIVTSVYSCSGDTGNEQKQKSDFQLTDTMAGRVKFDQVKEKNLEEELQLTGKIIPDENNMVKIFPLVGGQVSFVRVELGDLVNTTQTLAIIKSGEIAEFERELIAARTSMEVAKKNLDIEEELFKTNFSSEKSIYEARKGYEQAKAEFEKLEEIYKIYNVSHTGEYIVRSPIAGFVIEKKIGPDVQIRSDMADHILTVARLDSVFVTMNVYESDITRVQLGMDAEIKVFSYPDTVFRGKIVRILDVLDPDSKTIQARVKLANPGFLLKPDMNCSVTLRLTENKKMLAVPSASVVFDKSKPFVMVKSKDEKYSTREVKVFKDINGTAFIEQGVSPGEWVVSQNTLFVYDALND
ncbi:MAG: efflux RND transporter periplasmic adaptor subunit [Bacteroidota bacterium]